MSQVAIRAADTTEVGRRVRVVDADVHPMPTRDDIARRLSSRWRSEFTDFGVRVPNAARFYPRVRNGGYRLDSRPTDGGPAGSDLGLLRDQLLDGQGVDYGVLIPLRGHNYGAESPEFAAELCRALNLWVQEDWLDEEPRLRASICIPFESPDLAVREIHRLAGDERFVQVLLPTVADAPLGDRKYWPIYQAATEVGLPVAAHTGGILRHRGTGFPSYYLEHHVWNGNAMQALVMSLICEGVFDQLPPLQVVLIEGGITWAAPLKWAMDTGWSTLDNRSPRLQRPPSEYLHEHFWFTTQPIEEPAEPRHLWEALQHTGMVHRIMFASDYPHWDFDSPKQALTCLLPKQARTAILGVNASRLYSLGGRGDRRS